MRTKNAKGKPKYMAVSMSKLRQYFNDDMPISINVKYASIFDDEPLSEEDLAEMAQQAKAEENKKKEKENKIVFEVLD